MRRGQSAAACAHPCVRAVLWANTGSGQQACSSVLRAQMHCAAHPRRLLLCCPTLCTAGCALSSCTTSSPQAASTTTHAEA